MTLFVSPDSAWIEPEDPAYAAALAAHPGADIYHDPHYLRSVAMDGAVRVLLLPNLILPLVVRPLPDWLAAPQFQDAESPYGYAPPLVTGPLAWDAVARQLAAQGVINVFLRNHPLVDWGNSLGIAEITQAPVAVIPLAEGREQAFSGARCATHRSQVKRAKAQGFTVDVHEAPAALADFRRLYEHTMERLQAADFYRFGDQAWQQLCSLGARLALITVRDSQGEVHNQALFMRGQRFAHYHLSARTAHAHNAASHLLFEAVADWAISHGCSAIHLGGGTSGKEDDGLLAYKRRIGRQDAVFRTAGLITDPIQHVAMTARWQQRSTVPGRWFQTYRQPLLSLLSLLLLL